MSTSTRYFSLEMSIEELRTNFRKLCLELHPDKGGNAEDFKAMKNEYDYVAATSSILRWINITWNLLHVN